MAVDKKHVVSIRFTDEEYQPYQKLMDELGIGKTEFFRALILSRYDKISLPEKKEKPSQDFKKCLRYYNKSSNNMNQIAHRLNKENLNGIISDSLVKKCLNELITIRELMLGAFRK
ncbi:relaxosome protein [Salmonella enterica]|nr:relaxosome protein [Salmonella enterica]